LATTIIAARPNGIKGNIAEIMPAPVVMNDIVAFAYGGGSFYGAYISLVKRDSAKTWVSSRPLDMAYVFAMVPVGQDQLMVVGHIATDGFSLLGQTAPLIALTFRYDRVKGALELDDAATIPTDYVYTWPTHVGFMTYDTARQALVLLSPDQTTFERHVFDQLCHPQSPDVVGQLVPLGPVQAGTTTTWTGLTARAAMPVGNVAPGVIYEGSVTSTTYLEQPTRLTTRATTGTGTVAIGLASAASDATLTLTMGLSSFSVGVSNTATWGPQYGVESVSLLATSATFVVSAALSAAASATSVRTSATILAKRPIQATDAGGGTPRELDHPLSGTYTAPLVYPWSPPAYANIGGGQVLDGPLYATIRTLSKTAVVGFTSDDSDAEIVEEWPGGGDRIAMAWDFFSSLWDYFKSQDDLTFANGQFLEWAPKDTANNRYQVIITNLTVGGQQGVMLDHLAKQGSGFVHETVRMTMRIVAEI
jgi:hypothetical protein